MAAIVAGDTTATILFREKLSGIARGNETLIVVGVEITIDPGTTDTYPTGGILLTNLFTTGNASDTWLDTTRPIMALGSTILRYYDSAAPTTLTPACPAAFYNGGSTAATQTLVVYQNAADDGTKKINMAEHTTDDVTDSTNITNPIAGADKDMRCRLTLMGFLRPDVTVTGVAW